MTHTIGITMGCPVGIGPEIILKLYAAWPHERASQLVVLGDADVLRRTSVELELPARIVSWLPGDTVDPATIPVYNLSSLDAGKLRWGHPDTATGRAMAGYIEEAVALCRNKTLSAMVTCPITKVALNQAGYAYPGHTEMLASLTGAENYQMMMAGQKLTVSLVTIHEPLSKVAGLLTVDKIQKCISMTACSLADDLGMNNPRIAVAGLNPHGGEQGMFGTEERDIITPAIESYSGDAEISGPWPPDTVFHHAASGRFDAVVAMYHDQGLIPFKLLHFSDGVNVTLGLPIVRTSVDHGTAYDIAGKGKADCASLAAACSLAAEIVSNRAKRER